MKTQTLIAELGVKRQTLSHGPYGHVTDAPADAAVLKLPHGGQLILAKSSFVPRQGASSSQVGSKRIPVRSDECDDDDDNVRPYSLIGFSATSPRREDAESVGLDEPVISA